MVVGDVLVVPFQLAGVGVEGDGGVGVEGVVGDAGGCRGFQQASGVVGRGGAEIEEIELGVERALVPD